MPQLQIVGVSPNVVLLYLVSWALLRGVREGIALALVAGLTLDVLSSGPFGAWTLAMALATWLAGLGEINVFRTARLLPYLTVGVATLMYEVVLIAFLAMSGRGLPWWPTLWRIILPEMVIHTVAMALVYAVADRLMRRSEPEQVAWQ
jgi:rod shape-determining protein MreD